MLGRLLDQRYHVIQVLGYGGFGHTYIAEDTRRPGNPTCVVKHLKPATTDPEFLQTARRLFNSEAETLENLGSHDQIPRLLAYFEEKEEFYLVQEFVAGHPLSKELPPGTLWSEEQVIPLLQEVLSILEFVHANGVIHRDLKPDNLIRRAQDNKLVLVDFGAVKQVKVYSLITPEPLNNETVAIGTPGYMPSEQGQGRPRPNSDIYALGMIGIKALTGLSPTQLDEDPETGEIMWRQHTRVSDLFASVLSQMVRHYFKYRYSSATEALQALEPLVNPHTPKAIASLVSQMGRYYLREGYLSTAKAFLSLKELAQPAYIPPSHPTIPGSAPPATASKPSTVHSIQNTITAGANNASASASSPPTKLAVSNLSPHKKRLLLGAGGAIALIAIGVMSANIKPHSAPVTVQNKIQGQAVTEKTNSTPTNPQPKNSCVVAVARTTNLRSGPHGRDIGEIKAGTKVTIIGEEQGYVHISAPHSGWLYKRRAIRKGCPSPAK